MQTTHPIYRRKFLQAGATAAGAMLVGGFNSSLSLGALQPVPAERKLRILILGGTGFIGPWMAEFALARGHHVTLFNRGRREKIVGSTEGAETLYGNRDPQLHAQTKLVDGREVDDETSPRGLVELEGKQWDAVIDNSGYVPRIVEASAKLLAPNVGQYLFISTLSVYADNSKPDQDESAPIATIENPADENIQRHYGALKALCEQAAEKEMPGRVTIVRPGYIVGPGDTTDRFTYWPVRVSRGGEVLVPGNPDDPVQFIDVRDLVEFTVRCVEDRILGVYNATGPERKLPVSELTSACLAASKANGKAEDARFTYVPYDWLAANQCPIGMLPILLPCEGGTAGFHQRSITKALKAGLTFRSAEETCRAIIAWWPEAIALREKVAKEVNDQRLAQGLPAANQPAADELRAGVSKQTEDELLAKWRQADLKKR